MFSLLAVIFFAVMFILHLVASAPIDVLLMDLGLICLAAALSFDALVTLPWRRV